MSYVPNTARDQRLMLEAIGAPDLDSLFTDIPVEVRDPELDLPPSLSEMDVVAHLQELASRNHDLTQQISFLGAGWYDHYVPAFVDQMLLRSEYYTAYTPYQPEVSQGTLQTIYEFQSFICDLTGLDVANASMYDGGSALAEAMALALNATRRTRVLVADTVDPNYRRIADTYLEPLDASLEVIRNWNLAGDGALGEDMAPLAAAIDDDTACVVLQRPNFFGWLEDVAAVVAAAHTSGALVIMVADPVTLGVLRPPGEIGADIAVGELRHLAGPPSFGGPGAGYFATTQQHVRRIPGRIVGRTTDGQGRPGYVLTLQTREQHIRRERASSNICTNEALIALAATIHLAGLGRNGLRHLAELSIRHAHAAIESKWPEGFSVATGRPAVREFPVRCPIPAADLNAALREQGIIGGFDLGGEWPELSDYLLCAFTEKTGPAAIAALHGALPGAAR
jgi:glycine dehydrogenase subunit 1